MKAIKLVQSPSTFPVMNAAIIILFICSMKFKITSSYQYPTMDSLRTAVIQVCCSGGKRSVSNRVSDIDGRSIIAKPETEATLSIRETGENAAIKPNQMPLVTKIRAKSFIVKRGSMHHECCVETCDTEETWEGSSHTSAHLGEECIHEGCSTEEIREHC